MTDSEYLISKGYTQNSDGTWTQSDEKSAYHDYAVAEAQKKYNDSWANYNAADNGMYADNGANVANAIKNKEKENAENAENSNPYSNENLYGVITNLLNPEYWKTKQIQAQNDEQNKQKDIIAGAINKKANAEDEERFESIGANRSQYEVPDSVKEKDSDYNSDTTHPSMNDVTGNKWYENLYKMLESIQSSRENSSINYPNSYADNTQSAYTNTSANDISGLANSYVNAVIKNGVYPVEFQNSLGLSDQTMQQIYNQLGLGKWS